MSVGAALCGRSRDDRGLTLIELVVALAVFALIAVMGVQALQGTLRMRDALGSRDSRAAEMARATALLRQDLGALAPLLFFPPDGPPQSALFAPPDGLALTLGGQPTLTPGNLARQRAVWRLDPATGTLSRGLWPGLAPASAVEAAPDVAMLSGVTGLRLRSYWEGVGWQPGAINLSPAAAPADAAPADEDGARARVANRFASTLPAAVEVTLEVADFGPIVLVESLK